MAASSDSPEPVFSNLIEHLDMKGVRISPRFLAECIRDAKRGGAQDASVEAAFIAAAADLTGKRLSEDDQNDLRERFRSKLAQQ